MTNRRKRRRKRLFYELVLLAVVLVFVVGFSFRGSGDNIAAAVEKQGPPEMVPTLDWVPQPKQSMKGSTFADSIVQKEQELQQQESNQKIVYLTFDDGPTADAPKLLDTLDQFGAKATFFMLAPHIKEHPEVVKRMVEEGYAVGLHGVTHDASKFYRTKESPLHEMQEDQAVLEEVTGVKSTLIRTPYGSIPYMLDSYRKVMEAHGFQMWDWHIDSQDWNTSGNVFVSNVINGILRMEASGKHPIILLHDRAQTIQYLPKLLKWLNDNHYVTKSLDESMDAYNFKCENRCRPYGH
ncbi:polysaccharide deacetylase family protein [Heyndrickxia sp. NPDC080065]|uniref:polysaccharide deacetylase family protein n=1 Tax=Heyndrickxia sp. NPDC080065 TaxID=3390568 RepID=UPI003CFFBDC9